jgi:hypothetical protein
MAGSGEGEGKARPDGTGGASARMIALWHACRHLVESPAGAPAAIRAAPSNGPACPTGAPLALPALPNHPAFEPAMKPTPFPAALVSHPLVLWSSFAMKSGEMWLAAAQVIPIRLARMAAAGANPSARDRREMTRMGAEKVDAFSQAGLALALGMTPAMMNLGAQAMRAWMGLLVAGTRLATSRTLPQTVRRQRALTSALARHTPVSHRGAHAAATLAHAALAPVHATATANAKRLGRRK